MNDPVAVAARAAAQQLEAEAGPGLAAEVEAVLATRESPSAPPQYVDPVALASLIVAIAGQADAPVHIIEVVVTEAIRAATGQEHAEG